MLDRDRHRSDCPEETGDNSFGIGMQGPHPQLHNWR